MSADLQAARALGWASLAVGATELAATRWLEEQMGVDDHHELIRAFGVREIAAGATILSQPGLNKTVVSGMWSRVAGDAVDIAMLSLAARETRNPRGLGAVMAFVLAVTGTDILVATRLQRELSRANALSAAARRRVQPTQARPNEGADGSARPALSAAADAT